MVIYRVIWSMLRWNFRKQWRIYISIHFLGFPSNATSTLLSCGKKWSYFEHDAFDDLGFSCCLSLMGFLLKILMVCTEGMRMWRVKKEQNFVKRFLVHCLGGRKKIGGRGKTEVIVGSFQSIFFWRRDMRKMPKVTLYPYLLTYSNVKNINVNNIKQTFIN